MHDVPVTFGQSCECITSLQVAQSDPYAYMERGERCEGRYLRGLEAPGSTLPVVGYYGSDYKSGHHSYPRYLSIYIPVIEVTRTVSLRVTSKSIRTSYFLNTCVSDTSVFRWSSRVVRELGVSYEELIVKASSYTSHDSSSVLLPSIITDSRASTLDTLTQPLVISIRPQRHYAEIKLYYDDLNSSVEGFISSGRQFYPAQSVFDFRLPVSRLAGIVEVSVIGIRDDNKDQNTVYIQAP